MRGLPRRLEAELKAAAEEAERLQLAAEEAERLCAETQRLRFEAELKAAAEEAERLQQAADRACTLMPTCEASRLPWDMRCGDCRRASDDADHERVLRSARNDPKAVPARPR